jgi:hypothetical protein
MARTKQTARKGAPPVKQPSPVASDDEEYIAPTPARPVPGPAYRPKDEVALRPVDYTDKGEYITVKSLTGWVDSFLFTPDSSTVAHLQDFMQEQRGVPPGQQRLICKMVDLADRTRLLASYGVKAGDFVHIVLRMRGD